VFWTEGAICLVNARSGDLLNWRGAAMRLSLWGGVALTAPTILGLVARTTFAGSASRRCATPPVDRRHSEQADRDGHHAGDTSRVAG